MTDTSTIIDTTSHLFYGYTAIAIIIAGYLWSLSRRITKLMRDQGASNI